jgi:hypothetical protein
MRQDLIDGANSPGNGPIVVRSDVGGDPEAYRKAVETINASGRRVILDGKAYSSAGFYVFKIDNLTITHKGSALLHQAYHGTPKHKFFDDVTDRATAQLYGMLPGRAQAIVDAKGGLPKVTGHVVITAAEMHAMGYGLGDKGGHADPSPRSYIAYAHEQPSGRRRHDPALRQQPAAVEPSGWSLFGNHQEAAVPAPAPERQQRGRRTAMRGQHPAEAGTRSHAAQNARTRVAAVEPPPVARVFGFIR